MPDVSTPTSQRVAVLLAAGFEEADALICVQRLRESGIPVSLIGMTAGLVNSRYGIAIKPDISLTQALAVNQTFRIVLIPGGEQSTLRLLTDPRVHRVISQAATSGGLLAAMATAEKTLFQAGIHEMIAYDHFLHQGDTQLESFSQGLVDLLLN